MRTGRQTDMTTLIIAFHNFANAPRKIEITASFNRARHFFPAALKAQRDGDGGRILLGDNRRRGGHAAADRFQGVGVRISTGLPFCMQIYLIVRTFISDLRRIFRNITVWYVGEYYYFYYALQPLRLIVRSWLDVPTFATRRLHACHHARAPSSGRWNCGREMFGNFT